MSTEKQVYDVAIIGGGPAGVSCAIWLARLGFAPVLIEAGEQVGGLCRLNPFFDDWNATLPGMVGPEVANNLVRSLEQAKVPVMLSQPVTDIKANADGFTVSCAGNSAGILARFVVLATGVTARRLHRQGALAGLQATPLAPREPSAEASAVLIGPGEHVVAQDFHNKRVAVLGGGDNAFENALYALERGAQSVQIYARSIRAQHQFVRQIPVGQIVEGAYEVDAQALTVNGQHYDVIMVFYGWEPSAGFADGLHLQRTVQGYIATEAKTAETSCPGVYAIGEVAQRQHPCVVTAMADGVAAAKAIQAKIEEED